MKPIRMRAFIRTLTCEWMLAASPLIPAHAQCAQTALTALKIEENVDVNSRVDLTVLSSLVPRSAYARTTRRGSE